MGAEVRAESERKPAGLTPRDTRVPNAWWRTVLRGIALLGIGLIGASQGFSCLAIRGMRAEVAAQARDPSTGVWRGSEGFGWEGRPAASGAPAPAVLLLHGFLGTPNDLRPLAQRLRAAGYAVHAVRNPGHATTPEALRTTHRDAWRAAAREGIRFLRGRGHDRVVVVGFSMGGLLAAHAAAEERPVATVLLSPWNGVPRPVWSPVAPSAAAGWIAPLLPYVVHPKGLGGTTDPALPAPPHYDHVPLAAVAQLEALRREVVAEDVPRIAGPLLVVHSRNDRVAGPAGAEALLAKVGTAGLEVEWLQRTGHIVDHDVEREAMRARVLAFLAAHCPR